MALLLGMDLSTVLVFIIVFCIVYYVVSMPKNLPPGPPVIPFLGSLDFLVKGNRMEQFSRYHKQYGNVFRMYVGGYLVVVLSGFDVVRDAFVTQASCFSHRPNFMWWVSQIKEGIFMSSGQTWKEIRRFSLQTMRDFGMGKSSVEDKVKDEVNAILSILSENEGKRFHFHDFMDVATGNIICSLIFGERYDYHDEKFHKLMRLLNDVVKSPGSLNPYYAIPLLRMLPSTQKKARVAIGHMKRLCEFVKGVVDEHEQSYDPSNIRDFVDLYIQMRDGDGQANKAYNLENFLRLIVDLFLAGTETSSTSVNWALLYMMKYPHIQKKCQEEIDNNIGRGRMITFSDRAKLPYVEATVNEVLRLSPVGTQVCLFSSSVRHPAQHRRRHHPLWLQHPQRNHRPCQRALCPQGSEVLGRCRRIQTGEVLGRKWQNQENRCFYSIFYWATCLCWGNLGKNGSADVLCQYATELHL
ncbi:cytochrome P450 2J4-like isoform X2 [Haliotis rubra]|uniref:cytochrome P450 2J4-like isoform X2 n=1 Tax=Haliotis rubra TaxID=36100 RepID=UPI001EE5CAC2|nr:cytochrome P450 2J4-like isoform X2 [Haliotis rubra]